MPTCYKPVGLHTQREQLGVSCQAAGCEACTPSRKAGNQTSLESQRSLVDCNLLGNLETQTHGVTGLAMDKAPKVCRSAPSGGE